MLLDSQAGAGAGEPSGRAPLSVVLEAVQAQVPPSAERDRVFDAGRQLASGLNQKGVRSLAGKWHVRQTVGGANRGTTDILNEVQDNVRREAMRLLQERAGEEDAGAVSREACAAESTTEACSGRSSSEKLAVSAGKKERQLWSARPGKAR